jgi:hypothetical protein
VTAAALLERLERVRPAGHDAWEARCPAHEDRVASLSVCAGNDGRTLINCHAGCSAADVVASIGCTLSDLFEGERRPVPASRPGLLRIPAPAAASQMQMVLPRARRVATPVTEADVARWAQRLVDDRRLHERLAAVKGWSVTTLARLGVGFDGRRLVLPVRAPGRNLIGVLRYLPGGEPKMLASRGCSRELWPAPELLPDGALLVVEGEPDAISAMELGLSAVALPGAGKWRASWARRLAGRTLVVIGDCDDPGRDAAERLRFHVLGPGLAGTDVRIVDLDAGRNDGHDLGDEVLAVSRAGELGLARLRRRLLQIAGVDHQAFGALPSVLVAPGLRGAA